MWHGVAQNKIPTENKCAEPLGEAVRRAEPFGYSGGAMIDEDRFLIIMTNDKTITRIRKVPIYILFYSFFFF
jgi:hypothetical protein